MNEKPTLVRTVPGGRPSPFKFLDPYGPEDAALFFGRGFEVGELFARLHSGAITVVYGESGTGKTSLFQCGLRNRVRPEDILFVSVRTALDPDATLRQELL
ncbi:MAG: ATP-binding protein, partial [Sulfuricaulis sp.]|uniref:ATP-binding protein n=1 Tax=Sulfuricaulis sp. TaxID=2003553 RepID=UPI003C62255F